MVLVVLFGMRRRQAEKHHAQMQHISPSRELLEAHRASLEKFLEAPAAPPSLNALFSDIIADKDAMVGVADLLAEPRNAAPFVEDEEVTAQIARLESIDPDLMRAFASAVITGTLAGLLRWPETASRFEALSARLLSDPKRDVEMAVTASRYRKMDRDGRPTPGPAHAMA